MKKIFFNIIAIIALALVSAPAMAQYELEQGPSSYPDLPPDHWAYEAVTFLTDNKVVVGYPDGLYRPDQKVTRAEFSTMVIKALGLYEKETPKLFEYSDIENHWANRNIQVASYYGLVNGYPNSMFKPNADVTRIEALLVVLNALKPEPLDAEQARNFVSIYQDYTEIPNWALIQAGQAQMLGLVYNTPGHETTLEPLRPATRGELAKFIYNMLEAVQKIPSDKLKDEVKKTKSETGYVLDNVYYDEDYAVIPEGTILPMTIDTCMNTAKVQEGQEFVAKAPYNFVTREKLIVVPVGLAVSGKVHKVTRPHKFLSNGSMALTISNVIDNKGHEDLQVVSAVGERKADMRIIRNDPYLTRTRYNVVRGQNEYIHKGQRIDFVLLEPLRVKVYNKDDM